MCDRLKKIKKNKALESLAQTLAYSLSDSDLKTILGHDCRFVEYGDLHNYTMDTLLPNETDYVIILLETTGENQGHWMCITKLNKVISMMDSYGIKLQDELNYISRTLNRMLGNTKKEMEDLIQSAPDDCEVIYNKTPLQHQCSTVATCGRWCAAYVQMFKMGYSLCEFLEIVDAQCKEHNIPADVLVCKWISLVR